MALRIEIMPKFRLLHLFRMSVALCSLYQNVFILQNYIVLQVLVMIGASHIVQDKDQAQVLASRMRFLVNISFGYSFWGLWGTIFKSPEGA